MTRWRRLTWLATGVMRPPSLMLLEDAVDLAEFLETLGRTVPAAQWVEAYVEAARQARTRASIESIIG